MIGIDWDLDKVKRMKKKLLLQSNVVMLLIFLMFFFLFLYSKEAGSAFVLLLGFCLLSWGIAANSLYGFMTGRPLGTKTARYVLAFDKDQKGERKWIRQKGVEAIVVTVLSMGVTLCLFMLDFDSVTNDSFFSLLPFLGPWIGYNIGEIHRIKNL
ncbi:hypothetical protein [Pontibacillus salipaludis]|uniref:Uncharacterized protein n=1 Tax=Pontibacillus salipaludis TaxID=1697394 RepID=A0ABQ1Q259_9BACI|nr:hypothetical protein [Pontibacillus salipaludis]GGD09745.1 hypothetical protein GCM10011389_16540 [Pontibacillus salipaludis]